MLIDDVKKRMLDALKTGRAAEKEILRVALGDLQLAQSRAGSLSDEEAVRILRKIIKANDETMALSADPQLKQKLVRENEVLEELLPRTLNDQQIRNALTAVEVAIRNAPNPGAAMGLAMKTLKGTGSPVAGQDVARVVNEIREG